MEQLQLEVRAAEIHTGFEFAVRNFDELAGSASCGGRNHIKKTIFSVGVHTFAFVLYPNEARESRSPEEPIDNHWVCVGICREDDHVGDVTGSAHVEALLKNWQAPLGGIAWKDKDIILQPAQGTNTNIGEGLAWGWLAHLHDLKRLGYLCDGTLRFHVKFFPEFTTPRPHSFLQSKHTSCSSLARDFRDLLHSRVASDVTLVAGDVEFPSHWAVLACRSPVFQKMFASKMSEVDHHKILISDVDSTSMTHFLHFLYTGTVEFDPKITGSPVGEWFYGNQGFYKIIESDGSLKFVEGTSMEALLQKSETPLHWFGTFSNGATIELKLIDEKMESRFVPPGTDAPKLNTARSTQVETHLLQAWESLLQLADKYCVDNLAELCEQWVEARMDVFNAALVLRIANDSRHRRLKLMALNFIVTSAERMRSVQQTRAYDELDRELVSEISEYFFAPSCKRPRSGNDLEFPSGQDWMRLSNAQLRRACMERNLSTGGSRDELLALLHAQEQS